MFKKKKIIKSTRVYLKEIDSRNTFHALLFNDNRYINPLKIIRIIKPFIPKRISPIARKLFLKAYQFLAQQKSLPVSRSRKQFTFIKKYYVSERVSPKNISNLIHYPVSKAYVRPDINLYTIKDVFVVMGMSVLAYKNKYFYLEEDDLSIHVSPDEDLGINLSAFLRPKKIEILSKHKEALSYPMAMVISCRLASNYAHWVTDYLPRIILFYKDKKSLTVPLILSSSLHKNIIDSVYKYNPKILIHQVDNFCGIAIKKLYYVSPVSYVPYNFRSIKLSNQHKARIGFSHKFFKNFTRYYSVGDADRKFEKVYLLRKSNYRKILNEDEVVKVLKELGFLIIDPTSLSFSDQVLIFRGASIVVSAAGAALANIVFSNKKQIVVSILSDNPDHGFSFFPNLSYVSSACKIHFFFGTETRSSIHEDFSVNVNLLADKIRALPNFSSSKTV